jgi:hypothetical protein
MSGCPLGRREPMGEAFELANLDKKEKLHPHDIGDGYKMGEWLGPGGTADALMYLIVGPSPRGDVVGRWAGDRICYVSEFAEDLAHEMYKDYTDIAPIMREFFAGTEEEDGARWGLQISYHPQRHARTVKEKHKLLDEALVMNTPRVGEEVEVEDG